MITRDDVLIILSTLKAAFPHSFQNMGKRDAEALINLWIRQFENEDPQAVGYAVDSLIATRTVGFSPTIGEIKEQLQRLRSAGQLSEVDAWALVERASRNGLHHSKEEFDKLPPEVQRAVGGPEQLKAWAMMDTATVNSVVASNFRKSYAIAQEREKQNAMLPENVREMLSGVADQMSMKQIEPPKQKAPALMPAKLEPMKRQPDLKLPLPTVQEPAYRPPDPEEFEKQREKAMQALLSGKEGENVIGNEPHETESPVTAVALPGE